MITLSKPKDNLGGLLKLWVVPPASIVSLSPGTLTVSGTGDIIELYISPESAVAQCDLKRGQGGVYYEISVGGFTPGIRQEAEMLFAQMAGHDYLVVFQDGNGLYQVVGAIEEPLHFSFVARTGQVVSDRNGYEIQFSRNCTRPVCQVEKPF